MSEEGREEGEGRERVSEWERAGGARERQNELDGERGGGSDAPASSTFCGVSFFPRGQNMHTLL